MRKPINISISETEAWTTFAVICDDGTMYECVWTRECGYMPWRKIPPVPQEEEE